MKTRAAVLHEGASEWSVEEIELDPPQRNEVLVKMVASGLCHSDEHALDGHIAGLVPPAPMIGGHEGAGIVEEVGEGVDWLEPGDHVVFGFIPACGRCQSCAAGHSNLCDDGLATFPMGTQMLDGTSRHHTADGKDLGLMCLLGTFSEHTVVNEASVIKVDKDWPLEKGCLLGCGVVTGWGSSVYAADVQPGDYVAVVGIGGIGAAAVQGAKMAGARVVAAIDPSEFKQEKAMELGATHAFASMADAQAALGEVTWDRGYDKVIMAMGTGDAATLGEGFNLGGKRAKIVVTNLHSTAEGHIDVPAIMLTMFEKQLVGSLFGSGNMRRDIPKLFELYLQGELNLDDMVTKTYTLDEINDGYEAMRNAENVRGVILYN